MQVVLRDWELKDLPQFEYWMSPEHQWHETDGPYFPHTTPEEVAQMIARRREAIETGVFPVPRRSMVVAMACADDMIGSVSWYWLGQETNWLALGISLYDPANWGKGYGYEALGMWCEYMLEANTSLVRLDFQTWSGNTAMMRLAEKLGFRLEARFRKARIVRDEYYDSIGFGVLRTEWEQMYPSGFSAKDEVISHAKTATPRE